MVAVAVIVIVGLHLHLFTAKPGLRGSLPGSPQVAPSLRIPPGRSKPASTFHFPAAVLLYALLVVLLVAAAVLSIWWSRRFRPPGQARAAGVIVENSQDLREAVESVARGGGDHR
jgi:hypothetical protein